MTELQQECYVFDCACKKKYCPWCGFPLQRKKEPNGFNTETGERKFSEYVYCSGGFLGGRHGVMVGEFKRYLHYSL